MNYDRLAAVISFNNHMAYLTGQDVDEVGLRIAAVFKSMDEASKLLYPRHALTPTKQIVAVKSSHNLSEVPDNPDTTDII